MLADQVKHVSQNSFAIKIRFLAWNDDSVGGRSNIGCITITGHTQSVMISIKMEFATYNLASFVPDDMSDGAFVVRSVSKYLCSMRRSRIARRIVMED